MSTPALAPLRYRPFRLLVTARLVSTLGSSVAPIALAFAVLDLTGSARDLGYVVGTRSLLNVIFLLFGGVLADRLPRNMVMVVSSVVAGLSQGAVATLVITHSATIVLLACLSGVNGMAAALAMPASAALLPQTIPDTVRKQANAINRLGGNAAVILGASVGGILVAAFGSGTGLAIDAASFLVAAVFFGLVRVGAPAVAESGGPGLFTSLREGWQGFRSRTWLWAVVLGFTFLNAAASGGLAVLGPVVADATIGRRLWGFVVAAVTVGMIAGAFVAMRVRVRRLLRYGVLAVGLFALMPLAMAYAPHFAVLVVVGFIVGVGVEQFGIAWETTMQDNVPQEMLARVYSYDMLGSFIAVPVGEVAAGPAASAFGTDTTLLVAAGIIVASVIGMMLSADVRHLEHVPAPDGDAALADGDADEVLPGAAIDSAI